jgi:TonB family protein
MPEFPGGETALKKFIEHSMKYPEIAKENGIQGTVYVKFTIDKTGKVVHPEIVKEVDPSLDKEALRVANTLPKWKPGKQRGKAVNVVYTIPVNFELPSIQNSNKTIVPKNILYIVDGVEFKGDMKDIDPETIESVNVLKDESASKKYGIEGKDGVIEIKLKPSIIDTELKLRKFIAKEIKYPLEAVETNTDGIVSFLFRVDKNGHIFDIMKARKKDIDLETVVVSAYKTKAPGRFIKNQERDLLTKEVKRVIEKVPVIQIPEFSGKTVQVSVKFVLQD